MHHVPNVLIPESHHDCLTGPWVLWRAHQHEGNSCKWPARLKSVQLCYYSAPSEIRPTGSSYVRPQRSFPSTPASTQGAHTDPRRRHGYYDPKLPPRGTRLSWHALRRLAKRRQGQQRFTAAHPPRCHRLDRKPTSTPAPTSSRPTPSTPRRFPRPTTAWKRWCTSSTSKARALPARWPTPRHWKPGQASLRRWRARPYQPHLLDLPGRQRPGLSQRHLRRAGRKLHRGHPRPDRRRRRPAADRDHLRHPQRQSGDLRRAASVRGRRRRIADHDLRHHYRRLRPYPVGPDHRGVLELGAPRQANLRRPELRPGRQGPAPLP